MSSKTMFQSAARQAPPTTSVNHEGAPAYQLDARTALAQLAATGCFGSTFYVSGDEQLDLILEHAAKCSPEFVAKVAVYARQKGFMKDTPAVLLAHLAGRPNGEGMAALRAAFPKVIDNGKMVRNFVQVIRSGKMGRKSLGTAPKKLVLEWLKGRSGMSLFRDSVGNDPSLADVIKMVHPKPVDDERKALYGYLLGKEHKAELLPKPIQAFEAWKRGETGGEVPNVPSRMLQGLPLGTKEWTEIARNARWQETRMNLASFQRHDVFKDPEMIKLVSDRLRDPAEVSGAKAFPYQLMAAWKATADVPAEIQNALQDAMELSVDNVPTISGNIVICPDVSGSMQSPVTGRRKGATTAVRCIDVAGLVAAALLRKNESAQIIPFETGVVQLRLNPRDTVMTLANQLASVGGGGTNCSAPLALLNAAQAKVDAVIYVSDNESWRSGYAYSPGPFTYGYPAGRAAMMDEWMKLKARNPKAKLVCIDLTPNIHKQVVDRPDIMNVGGFSDAVFDVLAQFLGNEAQNWTDVIDATQL
jgi:60 kDa SS-A/Ro ribonucleoprotein